MKSLFGYLRPRDRTTGWIVGLAVVMPVLYLQFGGHNFFKEAVAQWFCGGGLGQCEVWGRVYQFLAAWVLFFCVPWAVWRLVLKRELAEAGWRVGDWKFGLKFLAAALVCCAVPLYVAAGQSDFQAEYPLAKEAVKAAGVFVLYEIVYFFYYMGWESFFRGFILFGLREHFGDFGAIAFQTVPSVLLHIGKPTGEIWASVVAGFVFGAWALRSGSVVYVLLFHYAVGVLNDLFCTLRGGLFA